MSSQKKSKKNPNKFTKNEKYVLKSCWAERVMVVPEILAMVVLAPKPVPVNVMPGTIPAMSAAAMVIVVAPLAAVAALPAKSAEVNATLLLAKVFKAVAKFVDVVAPEVTVENVPFLPLKLKLTSLVTELPENVN